MRSLLPVLVLLACPLMMIFMMRGMHSGHENRTERPNGAPPIDQPDPRDARLAELEREVAELRAGNEHEPSRR